MSKGISKLGTKTEQAFRKITGAFKSDDKTLGDAKMARSGGHVEIKLAEGGTANQCRAYKCIPHVICTGDGDTLRWFVISPERLISDVISKRGQHGESPLETKTVNPKNYLDCEVPESDLEFEVERSIQNFENNYSHLRELVDKSMRNIRAEVSRSRAEIIEHLEGAASNDARDFTRGQSETAV
ncbi:hypothetical protein LCGC14_1843130 [marine sediment metagenome]|uniref:Uncharacterized protein n=1 Tax=marine sediment metagenome TaxID=412755 RepID=A0A0F9IS72_9ZZZZ